MRIVLSTSSGVPLYEQIARRIRSAVHGGELAPGAHLPSLRALAAELQVSVITVTRAYNDLEAEGLVAAEHGRGYVVREVDAGVARAALRARTDAAVAELVEAARAARMTRAEAVAAVERAWTDTDTDTDTDTEEGRR